MVILTFIGKLALLLMVVFILFKIYQQVASELKIVTLLERYYPRRNYNRHARKKLKRNLRAFNRSFYTYYPKIISGACATLNSEFNIAQAHFTNRAKYSTLPICW